MEWEAPVVRRNEDPLPIITTDSIILQVFPYGDTSKILRLLTASHGLRSAIAKGALRPRSRFGGVLEPFAAGVATLVLRDGRDLHTLSGFELERSRQKLGSDLLRFAGASLIAELVVKTGSEESQPDLFDRVRRTLQRLQDCETATLESAILAGVWAVVSLLGFAPELETCLDCARELDSTEETRFDYVAGGARCSVCAAGRPGKRLPAHARSALARLAAGEEVPLEETAGHWHLISMFLDHHVLEGGSLRSLSFLAQTVNPRR